MGLTFNAKAREYLPVGDEHFFEPVLPELVDAAKLKFPIGGGSKL